MACMALSAARNLVAMMASPDPPRLALGGLSYEHERAANGGYGADSAPSQDDPGRLTFRPLLPFKISSVSGREARKAVFG